MKITKFRILTLILISIEIFLGLFKDYIVERISNNDIFKTLNFNINHILILLFILCLVLVFVEYFQEKQEHKIYEHEHNHDNTGKGIRRKVTPKEILLKLISTEVNSRLEQSLHNRVYIILDIDRNNEQVETPWEMEVKVGNKPLSRLKNTEITTVFDQQDVSGRLLILGQPGVGKTTMLLKLAEELVERAKEDSTKAVPVLFSLPTWNSDKQSIKDWLIEQLKEKYGVRKDIGKQWVDSEEIIPLLDGLDELAAERQELCVRKINDFLQPESWTNPLVVCSRTQEYQHYETLLKLNNSLELCPLTPQQVFQYLHKTDNFHLWESFNKDADLCELAKKPFLLNVIVISAQEISIEKWQQFNSSDERLSYLFETYINKMLLREYKSKKPTEEQKKRWLGWLAKKLVEENQTEFLIERIQPDWLESDKQRIYRFFLSFYALFSYLVISFILFLSYKFSLALIVDLGIGVEMILFSFFMTLFFSIVSIIFGIVNSYITDFFYKNIFKYKLNKSIIMLVLNSFIISFMYSLLHSDKGFGIFVLYLIPVFIYLLFIINILCKLFGEYIEIADKVIFSLARTVNFIKKENNEFFWAKFLGGRGIIFLIAYNIYVIPYSIFKGVSFSEIKHKKYSNQGIFESLFYGIKLLISTIVIVILFDLLLYKNQIDFNSFELFDLIVLVQISFLPFFIIKIIKPAIQHFSLRLALYFNGYIPWNYAKFLDYCTNRLFLQRVGGSYRFMHDLLRQHFAQKYAESNNTQSPT